MKEDVLSHDLITQLSDVSLTLISKPIRREIESLGWSKLTEIQELAFPLVLEGENLLLIAPTGTGKTEAAIFPIFERFIRERSKARLMGISILYVTPLRALNRDIFRRLVEIGERLDIVVDVRHGDTPQSQRRKQALKPPNMLITTPETLQAILPGRRMSNHLKDVRWVIVDEIHELATDKRGVQLSVGLERIGEIAGREFQRIGLSATIGCPELIGEFLVGQGRNVKVLKTSEAKDFSTTVESPTAGKEDVEIAEGMMVPPGSVRRIRRIFDIINDHKTSLIFTNTREHAEALVSRMRVLKKNAKIGVHHGSLSREVRIDVESKLKNGELEAVVSTSSLELGIDVGLIEFVVQYMSPRQVTKLVQRIGRSGHIVNATSKGCILAGYPDDVLEAGAIARFAGEGRLEEPVFHEKALDVLAHQIVGLTLTYGGMLVDEVLRIVSRAWPYRDLTEEEVVEVITQLERQGTLRFDGSMIRGRTSRSHQYYYSTLSMIPDVKRFRVRNFISKRVIGTLDQGFVARHGNPGQELIMRGNTWKIVSVDEDELEIQVESVYQSLAAVPSWEGETIPVPFEVAQEVGKIRRMVAQNTSEDFWFEFLEKYQLDDDSIKKAYGFISKNADLGFSVPTDRKIVIECLSNYSIIHSCFGSLVNNTLAIMIASILTSKLGVNVATQADPYRIALITPISLRAGTLKKELMGLRGEDIEPLLRVVLGETSMFAWRLWQVGRRFGAVMSDSDFRLFRARMLVKALQDTPIFEEALREVFVEKLDVKNTKKVFDMIREGFIEVVTVPRSKEASPFALPLLDRIAPHDVLRPAEPIHEIVELVKERIGSKSVRLVCVFNADYEGVRRVLNLPDRISCPKCGSTLMAATYLSDRDLRRIVEKKMSGKKLTGEEKKEWMRGWKSASLVQNYGKQAIIALAAHGVGPQKATSVLRRFHPSEEHFYMDLVKAEREYVRTRAFWDN